MVMQIIYDLNTQITRRNMKIKDRLGADNSRPLNVNFSVQATLWNDNTYIINYFIAKGQLSKCLFEGLFFS